MSDERVVGTMSIPDWGIDPSSFIVHRSSFRLMLVTDRTLAPHGTLPALVDRAVAGGVDVVQLREKDLAERELLALGRDLRAVTRGRALLLVNGTVEQALAIEADGVHLAEAAPLPAGRAGLLAGRSVHAVAEAQRAMADGVDYIVAGTVFSSRSHPDGPTGGPRLVADICRQVSCPLIAIGGISASNAARVIEAGASGVAVISAILGAADPHAAAASLRAAVDAACAAVGARA